MLRDYLRAFWLGVSQHKLGTLINVGGLALGLAVFIALSFYVYREFSWDEHWLDAGRIYRPVAHVEAPGGGNEMAIPSVQWRLRTTLHERYPDAFEVYVGTYAEQVTLQLGDAEHPEQLVFYAEPSLPELFQFETLEGSLDAVFADPASIALNVETVTARFGGAALLGKTLTLTTPDGRSKDHVVRAIYRVPQPTTLEFSLLALFDPAGLPSNVEPDAWDVRMQPAPEPEGRPTPKLPLYGLHYFKLRQGIDAGAIEADLRAFMDGENILQNNGKIRFSLQPLPDAHLGSAYFEQSDNALRLWVYAIIGTLVLLISGCNFVMLATLRSVDRMREVGIRKTLGGEARQLLCRYLLDAFLLTLLATCLALALLELFVPALQGTLGEVPDFTLNWRSAAICFGIATAFALLSGIYPAWLMARGKPALLLRNGSGALTGGGSALRKLLVCIQFAIVISLLLASGVVQQQIALMQNLDRGFSVDTAIGIQFSTIDHSAQATTLAREFESVPGVQRAGFGLRPGAFTTGTTRTLRRRLENDDIVEAQVDGMSVSPGYFEAMSVRMLAGSENLAETQYGGEEGTIKTALNAAAVRDLGFASPIDAIGSLIERDILTRGEVRQQSLRVVAVVADMQFLSLMLPPIPMTYTFGDSNSFLVVKLEPGADYASVLAALEERWHAVLGAAPFLATPGPQLLGPPLERERFEARVVLGSTALAIVIALLGLYGLAAASVVKRIKEIGVRKVMGADAPRIVMLLLWQFSQPVVLASLVAWPLGFWGVRQWLERFPFRLDLGAIVLSGVLASLLALLIAWLTIGWLAARAASAKPVLALRYE